MRHSDLEVILAQLLEAEDAGEAPDIDALVQKHPEHAAELHDFLTNRKYVERFADSAVHQWQVRLPTAGRPPPASPSALERVGDYELIDQIASGGMGVVYRARHAVLGRMVALKMMRDGRLASASHRQRFLIEARAAARLDHPNIVPLFEVSQHGDQPYFTMKLVEGPSLAEHLGSWIEQPREAARLVLALARAMHYAHQRGIMHRDLKPGNILLEEITANDGSSEERTSATPVPRWRPLITDFGLAKLLDAEDLTRSGAILGTPAYMAPEQAAGSGHDVAITADIYSLGAILYALFTGRPAFRGTTPAETLRQVIETEPKAPRKLNPRVQRDLETICLKCLEKDPRRRYGSAEALADDLERCLAHRPVLARRSSVWEHARKWARRRPAAAALVAVVVAAALTVMTLSLWYNARLETEIANVRQERQHAQDNSIAAEGYRREAEDRELVARRHAYAAQTNLAYQAWEAGQLGRALQLLHAQVPSDGQSDLRSFEWHHLSHRAHRNQRLVLRTAHGPVRGLQFCPDSQRLIYGGADGAVRIHDPQSGNVTTYEGRGGPIRTIALSPRGDCVATRAEDGTLRSWTLSDGSERFVAKVQRGPFTTPTSMLAFSPDGHTLAVRDCQEGRVAELLDAHTGQRMGSISGHEVVNALVFTPDGQTLALATNSKSILLAKVTGEVPLERLGTHNAYVVQLALSPDGTTLASSSEDGVVKLWDLTSRKLLAAFEEHTGTVQSLAFTPDGRCLASGGEDGSVKVRDLVSGAVALHGHEGTVYSIAFSSDGTLMAAGDADGNVTLWAMNEARPSEALEGHAALIYSLSFSPDSRTLASGSADKTIRLWEVASGAEEAVLAGHTGWVASAVFSPDGSMLASGNILPGGRKTDTGDETGTLKLWDVAMRRLTATLQAHNSASWQVAFAPDGRTIATAGYMDNTVKLWDAKTQEVRTVLSGHPRRVWSVAYSPDGTLLASASAADVDDDETVFVWDVATRTVKHRLRARWVWSVAFSPDGKLLATGSEGGLVKLWDVDTGTEAVAVRGHPAAVKCVAFAPDGKVLASAGADKAIRLWDVVTGDERATLTGHDKSIYALAFAPDGRTLASGDWGGAIRLWRTGGESSGWSSRKRPAAN